jgi:F-type H+-transporting ATPase subunit epsilon
MLLEIVTAEELVYSEEIDVLVAPGIDGELGILPRHAPLLTALKPGEIRVVKDGEETFMAVSAGFMEVLGNKVTILADTAERVDDIDVERAEEALRLAEERVEARASDMDLERALSSIRRSQARLKVARRRRPRADRGAPPS